MGTHPIFESDFDCLTEFRMEIVPRTDLEFRGDRELSNQNQIQIKNVTKSDLFIKIRTTGPSFYIVKPNGIKVKSGEVLKFNITLRPNVCNKLSGHKFKVEAIPTEPNPLKPNAVYHHKFKSVIIRGSNNFELFRVKLSKNFKTFVKPDLPQVYVWLSILAILFIAIYLPQISTIQVLEP